MNPRQARRERREAERKAKKLEIKKGRLPPSNPLAAAGAQPDRMCPANQESGSSSRGTERRRLSPPGAGLSQTHPEIPPRWNPELEDEFPREVQIRNNALFDRHALELGLSIPPPGPSRPPIGFVSQKRLLGNKSARPALSQQPTEPATEIGFVSQRRIAANRANAQLSTGARTSQGKLASSRNSTKHGLASGTLVIPGEDPAAFAALLHDLLEEHQPATRTEDLLIEEMAQSYWLTQRAIRLQNECFTAAAVDQKQLLLFLRYQTTHQRRFYKALDTLLKLKKSGFVSQCSPKSAKPTGFASQPDSETPTH